MRQSEELAEDATYRKHQDVCEKLNMDAATAKEAWQSYENIRQNYTLEGDQLHWIGCALYAACRSTFTPTVGTNTIEGNCVSLTRLLKLCNLPLMEFFKKSKAWADMCNMPANFSSRIDKLQQNFSVSSIIFQKYQPIFCDIFKDPTEDLINKPPRSRRHRIVPCRPSRLFEFGWSLFICIKGGISTISDDLVNSLHLLLVCCDLLFSNALMANRKDLLNPEFPGLPENFNDDDFVPPDTAKCIVNILCERHEAIAVEATVIKQYSLKRYINKLFNEKILRGDQSNFSGILEAVNFEGNLKAVNKAYEQRMLQAGDFDERIFLAEWRRVRQKNVEVIAGDIAYRPLPKGADSNSNIGSSPNRVIIDFPENNQKKDHFNTMNPLAPPTPLTGRKYLKSKDISNSAPASNPTQCVVHLQTLLVGCKSSPSESLLEIFKNASPSIKTFVESKIEELGKKFHDGYLKKTDKNESSCLDFGKQRLQSSQKLFYKVLEMVLNDEKSKKPNFDIQLLLKNELFLQCLFACCCEIVIYSYQNKDRTFPWILSALDLEAYYFYRVIEVTIKVAVDHLSREMVKHLNRIEEMILESLAWKSSSPLWQDLADCEGGVPSYEDVALPGTFQLVDPITPGQPVLRKLALDRGTVHNDVPQSPISSASERFQSPTGNSAVAKKRLFNETVKSTSVLKGTQSVLTTKGSQEKLNGPVSTSTPNNQPATVNRDQTKPRRTGSLALFFRKFYNLTNTRLQSLADKLKITEDDVKRKIWTIFEYSIVEKTHLMKDRHLDQILMSAVYVICKIGKLDKYSFTEIMRCYRDQPQAESHIYRSVLISKNAENSGLDNMENGRNKSSKAPPTPTDMAGTSTKYGEETRGDLIKFYNTVYVPEVQQFATRSLGEGRNPTLTMSPMPKTRFTNSSPVRRVTESLMTRVLDPKEVAASPAPQLHYCFNRSPAKDLEAINKMVNFDARKIIGKRLLSDDPDSSTTEMEEPPLKKNVSATFVARKLENIIGDRLTQNS